MAKYSVWGLWIGSLAAMLFGSGWVVTAGAAAFGLTLVAHVVEFFMQRPLFERAEGSMGHHLVQTLIYGFFHWAPLKEALGSGGDEAA